MYRGLVRGGWMREAWCDDTSVTRQGRWGTESPPQRCVRVIVFALSPPHTHSRPSYVVGCGGAVTGVACLAFPLLDREYVDGRSIGSSDIVQFSFLLLLGAGARDRSCALARPRPPRREPGPLALRHWDLGRVSRVDCCLSRR